MTSTPQWHPSAPRPSLAIVPADPATAARTAERAAAVRRPLTAGTLATRLGLTLDEAAHMVQPFCTCYLDEDGWHYCPHMHDERTPR